MVSYLQKMFLFPKSITANTSFVVLKKCVMLRGCLLFIDQKILSAVPMQYSIFLETGNIQEAM